MIIKVQRVVFKGYLITVAVFSRLPAWLQSSKPTRSMANSVEEDYLPSSIPRFILVGPASDTPPSLGDAWREAIKKHVADLPALSFIVHEAKLENIDPNFLKNDCMAIPTNSYGIMDGGYVNLMTLDHFDRPLKDMTLQFQKLSKVQDRSGVLATIANNS